MTRRIRRIRRIRRLIAALARTANWRCAQCDTFNGETDAACFTCGSGRQ